MKHKPSDQWSELPDTIVEPPLPPQEEEEFETEEFPKPAKVPSFEDFDLETINETSEYKYDIYKEKPKSEEDYKDTIIPGKRKATLDSTQLLKLCSEYLDKALK